MANRDPGVRPVVHTGISWRILIPGWPQWCRRDDRAKVIFGTFATAIGVGLFAWGSRPGFLMLGLAFVVHVFSASDVIRTSAFPGFSPWVPSMTASFGLGLGCYLPSLAMASLLASPEQPSGRDRENYLINRWAFQGQDPRPGDWIWYEQPQGGGFGLGRLIARAGQSAEWTADRLSVDGVPLGWVPSTRVGRPVDLSMIVPDEHLLVAHTPENAVGVPSMGISLLPRNLVVGRPWARMYPIWSRGLLY